MINGKRQGWCFDGSEIVDVKPSLHRVFIKRMTTSIGLEEVVKLASETLKLKKGEAEVLYTSLTKHGEWLLGTYQADLAETIVQDLSAPIRKHGLELSISPLRE